MSNPTLEPILAELNAITADAKSEFGALSAAQINWKPAADKWSIAQCFDHLINANVAFFPEMERIIAGGRKNSTWESISPFTGFIGRWMIKSLDPKSQKRLPAPKQALPSTSDVDPAIIDRFAENQAKVHALIAATDGIDLKKTVITSPFLKVATYSLLDGFQIVAVHERRHLGQAQRVMQAPGFPAA
ncbi:MAG: DinB family protein [Pyrinomonadaceae bacterium]